MESHREDVHDREPECDRLRPSARIGPNEPLTWRCSSGRPRLPASSCRRLRVKRSPIRALLPTVANGRSTWRAFEACVKRAGHSPADERHQNGVPAHDCEPSVAGSPREQADRAKVVARRQRPPGRRRRWHWNLNLTLCTTSRHCLSLPNVAGNSRIACIRAVFAVPSTSDCNRSTPARAD